VEEKKDALKVIQMNEEEKKKRMADKEKDRLH